MCLLNAQQEDKRNNKLTTSSHRAELDCDLNCLLNVFCFALKCLIRCLIDCEKFLLAARRNSVAVVSADLKLELQTVCVELSGECFQEAKLSKPERFFGRNEGQYAIILLLIARLGKAFDGASSLRNLLSWINKMIRLPDTVWRFQVEIRNGRRWSADETPTMSIADVHALKLESFKACERRYLASRNTVRACCTHWALLIETRVKNTNSVRLPAYSNCLLPMVASLPCARIYSIAIRNEIKHRLTRYLLSATSSIANNGSHWIRHLFGSCTGCH